MKRLLQCLCVAALLGSGLLSPAAGPPEKPAPKLTEDEAKLIELTNQERANEKLAALKPNPVLCRVARAHSANMARQGVMNHVLDGKGAPDRIKAAGYKYASCGENIGAGDTGLEAVLKAWMNSKVHRDNILHRRFTQIGVGIVTDDKGKAYYTQVFATPRP
jgi:uncharacterized protein YkwD